MTIDDLHLIDPNRSACLCDGGCNYAAVVAVAADGSERLVLAKRSALDDEHLTYDAACSDVLHEQCGALPLEYVRRITIAHRKEHP